MKLKIKKIKKQAFLTSPFSQLENFVYNRKNCEYHNFMCKGIKLHSLLRVFEENYILASKFKLDASLLVSFQFIYGRTFFSALTRAFTIWKGRYIVIHEVKREIDKKWSSLKRVMLHIQTILQHFYKMLMWLTFYWFLFRPTINIIFFSFTNNQSQH